MLSEEQHILIDKFFSEELTAEEAQQFQNLLRDDVMFRSEVELQQQVILGIGAYGAQELKAELSSIHSEVKGEVKEYKPRQGGSGSSVWSAVKLIVTLGALGAAGYFGYKYYTEHKQEIHEQVKQMDKGLQPPAQGIEGYERRDTVWHTIKSVSRKDTVLYGEEALKEYMNAQPTQPGAAQQKVIIKVDTLRVPAQ